MYEISFCLFVCYGCTHNVCKFSGQGFKLSCGIAATYATAAVPDPLIHCASLGIEHAPLKRETQAIAVRFLTHCATVGTFFKW